ADPLVALGLEQLLALLLHELVDARRVRLLALHQLHQRERVSDLEDARRALAGGEHERRRHDLRRAAETGDERVAAREPAAAPHPDPAVARGLFERFPAANRVGELLRASARALAQRLAPQQIASDLLADRLERADQRLLPLFDLDQMDAEIRL